MGLKSVSDLARKRPRFVNRQKGSGTRAWFDRLLGEHNIKPETIVGYEVEEFTHQAVGALIKAGLADVGLGVRAVAEALGLSFVSLGRETYFLARSAALVFPALDEIEAELNTRSTETIGYVPAPGRYQSTQRPPRKASR
jgi:molybdate-binding protein